MLLLTELFVSPFDPTYTEEQEFSLLASHSVSSAAGSDIENANTHVESGASPTGLQSLPETLPTGLTPSTASFLTTPDSTHEADRDTSLPTICDVIDTASQEHVPQAKGSVHDFSPRQSQKKLLPQQDGKVEWEDGLRRTRHKGACSLPPLHGGRTGLLLQLKVEEGGARALWRSVFSGNRKEESHRGRTIPPSAEGTTNQKRVTGNDENTQWCHNQMMMQ